MFFKSKHTDAPTPELGFEETGALIKAFNEEGKAHGTTFSRFDGALMALLATKNAPVEQVWELSDYPHASAGLRVRAAPYIRDTARLLAAGYLSPQMENCRPAGNFADWLSGVGDVLGLIPEKAMVLVSYPSEEVSGATLPALMLARRNPFIHTDEKSRQDVLKGLHELDDDARLNILLDFPGDLMALYGDPDMEQVSREQFGGSGILRAGVRGQPIRREGKKVLPNAPCPCGSGKKYKKCCGAPGKVD